MDNVESRISELTKYALAKRGAELPEGFDSTRPSVELTFAGPWNSFMQIGKQADLMSLNNDQAISLHVPVRNDDFVCHRERYPAISESSWMERDGHEYLLAPLNLPLDFLKSLIDDAYSIVWNKLDEKGRFLHDLVDQPYDEQAWISQLIDFYELNEYRSDIHDLIRPAILLLTKRTAEDEIELGATKIGGSPDLPSATAWPLYRDGRPLAFLAQLNLDSIAALPRPIPGLPTRGILSVFSVWGWADEDDLDPTTPNDGTFNRQEGFGWTVVLHLKTTEQLSRQVAPKGLNVYHPAAVEPIPILSLPNHRAEPPFAKLRWSDQVYRRFDSVTFYFRALQELHWRRETNSPVSFHQLGGYARFMQTFPDQLLEMRLAMFLQLVSDANTEMWWGDCGDLTFYADEDAMRAGRLERIFCEFQCG